MGIFGSIAKIAKAVVKNPITKVAAGGLAIAFPPIGIPAAAGVAIAGKVVDAAQGKRGTPAQQATAKRVVANTIVAARNGDAGAARAVVAMKKAQVAKGVVAGMSEPGWHINRAGTIRRVG